ncbi:SCO family protein [Massilia jejuensis]|uniref:SCO family protein n=1 Tax=Massilia jejuensis TaxID=648894 RepID=UPI0036D35513
MPAVEGRGVPNVALLTHEGRHVRFQDDLVRDRLVVVNMMYANCTNLCPPGTANLLRVQELLGPRVGRDVFMYSLTLQPAIDKPLDLRRYMAKFGVKPGWTFLTGEPDHVELLRLRLGFYSLDALADSDLKQHTGMLRIGHAGRDRWSMVPALAAPDQIVNSIASYI